MVKVIEDQLAADECQCEQVRSDLTDEFYDELKFTQVETLDMFQEVWQRLTNMQRELDEARKKLGLE